MLLLPFQCALHHDLRRIYSDRKLRSADFFDWQIPAVCTCYEIRRNLLERKNYFDWCTVRVDGEAIAEETSTDLEIDPNRSYVKVYSHTPILTSSKPFWSVFKTL